MVVAEGAYTILDVRLAAQQTTDKANLRRIIDRIEGENPLLATPIYSSKRLEIEQGLDAEIHASVQNHRFIEEANSGNTWSRAQVAIRYGEVMVRHYLGTSELDDTYQSRLHGVEEKTFQRYIAGASTAGDVLGGLIDWVDRKIGLDPTNISPIIEEIIQFSKQFMRFPIHWALYFSEAFTAARLDDSLELKLEDGQYRIEVADGSVLWNILRFESREIQRKEYGENVYKHKNSDRSFPFQDEGEELEVIRRFSVTLAQNRQIKDADTALKMANAILVGLKAIPFNCWDSVAIQELTTGELNINPEILDLLIFNGDLTNLGKMPFFEATQAYHAFLAALFQSESALGQMLNKKNRQNTIIANYAVFGFDPNDLEAKYCPAIFNGTRLLKNMARAAGYKFLEFQDREREYLETPRLEMSIYTYLE